MTRIAQIYNPVHGQRIHRSRMTVMGRILDPKITSVAVHLDHALIRRVRVAHNGVFECRMDISRVELGQHDVEIRVISGVRTERMKITIFKIEKPDDEPDEPDEDSPD